VLPDGEWIQRQTIAKQTTETRWAGLQLGRYQSRVTAIDIYGRVGGWVLSPEVLTANTAIVDTSNIGGIPTSLILVLSVSNLSTLSLQIWNTGTVNINAFGFIYKTHSAVPTFDRAIAGFFDTATIPSLEVASTFNAIPQNNVRLPFLFAGGGSSNPGIIAAGSWKHVNISTAGLAEIAILAKTASSTTTVKVFSSGKPLAFDFY
jgi:hypothetical protein